MQIGFLLAALIVVSSVEVNKKESASQKPTKMLVEVWCGGDDNLTRGVCLAAENAFESSADFTLAIGENKGTLVVTIPTNVDWKEMNQRSRVFYTVEFSAADAKKISKRKGACWEDDLAACANQIVKEAKIAQRKILAKH
jgi:hypothetical protein